MNRSGSGFEVWFRFSLDISEFGAIGRDERDSGVTGEEKMIMMMMINVTSAVFHLNPEGVSGLSIQLCYSIFRLFESICMDIRGGEEKCII